MSDLGKQPEYELLSKELLKQKELKPNNGKKTDPAHPAIYPTGLVPGALKDRDRKVYDLVVKRFLATFAKPAIRETMEVVLKVKSEDFIAKGTRTMEENWHVYYKPYVKVDEVTLPNMKEGETIVVSEIKAESKETQPPNRYNQSSIIKELEKRNLGTKATRADILERLFERGYIEGVQITVSKLGMETVVILEKYAPTIVDEKLTADFEERMEQIREGKEKPDHVLEEAKKILTVLLSDFKKKEKSIGQEIVKSIHETRSEQNYIGKCSCSGTLAIKFSKFGRFVGCDKYPDCKITFKLPGKGLVKSTGKVCDKCSSPIIQIAARGRRMQETCLNSQCSSKVSEDSKEAKKIEQQSMDKKCPKCEKPMVLRRSVYGAFLGCSGYPACKTIMKLGAEKKERKEEKKGKAKK